MIRRKLAGHANNLCAYTMIYGTHSANVHIIFETQASTDWLVGWLPELNLANHLTVDFNLLTLLKKYGRSLLSRLLGVMDSVNIAGVTL